MSIDSVKIIDCDRLKLNFQKLCLHLEAKAAECIKFIQVGLALSTLNFQFEDTAKQLG